MGEIILKFGKGQVRVEANGFRGQACDKATAFLKVLGNVERDEKKTEWFEENLQLTGELNSNYCG